ncbi:hypothetical protein O181_101185 [Austropuccinia psidii MF-1]|uniref:Uncharacterized protein n=1 Tax=Austropuccinia psidii MF-1 TaxID=1389203 RepID=A0A9Q3PHI2_9BASI|nr:hypothetical protein [Austropuccinia psidii MF-1]
MAYQATVLLWQIGHIHHQWPIWPRHHLMDHLQQFVFWGFSGPSPQSRSHSGNLCPIGYFWAFPSKPGEMAQMAVLAIWAHNAHLRTFCAFAHISHFAHFDTKCPKDTFSPFGAVFGSEPKSGQSAKGPRNTFPSSEAIPFIFFPSVFPSQDLRINSMVAIANGHLNIPEYHHAIKAPTHSEDSSRLKSKCFSIKDQSHHQYVIG